jgi:hypothetical protein
VPKVQVRTSNLLLALAHAKPQVHSFHCLVDSILTRMSAMYKRYHLLWIPLWIWALAGCGSASPGSAEPAAVSATNTSPAHVEKSQPQTAVVLPVQANSSPQEVVLAFLNGMRDGNSGVTAGLLTDQAQDETVKHNWPVQPPGAPSATYRLGDAAYVDQAQSGVQVPCVWSEPDGTGGKIEFAVSWMLRRQADGWRIAGFASEVVPGRPAYYFNFEDIANLKAAQADAEAVLTEMAKASSANPAIGANYQSEKTLR